MQLLLLIKLGVELVDARAVAVGVATEGNVEVLEELVAAREQGLWGVSAGLDGGLAVEDDDAVGEVGGHDEIVLDDEGGFLGVHDEALDDAGGDDTLLGVEVGGGLVDEVDVCGHAEGEDDSDTLEFSAGEVLDFLVDEVVHLEGLVDVGLKLGGKEGGLDLLEEELADGAGELGGDLLGLHGDVHGGDLLAVVGLEGAGEHFAEGGLSGTILTHHDDDLGVSELAGFDVQLEVA